MRQWDFRDKWYPHGYTHLDLVLSNAALQNMLLTVYLPEKAYRRVLRWRWSLRQDKRRESLRNSDSMSRRQLLTHARELEEYHRRERELQDTLSQRESQLQEMAATFFAEQERDRQSMAFEVHDRIAQSLVSVFHHLQTLESMTLDNPQIQKTVARASDTLHAAIQESRILMKDLHSPLLEQYGVVPLIKEDLRLFQQDTKCYVRSNIDYPERLSPDMELALYRVFQEALMNIRRHAPKARSVIVSLRFNNHTVSLQVQDDGPGLNAEAGEQGFRVGGITGMRRRAEAVGWSLELTSAPDHGTRVALRIPIADHPWEEKSVE